MKVAQHQSDGIKELCHRVKGAAWDIALTVLFLGALAKFVWHELGL